MVSESSWIHELGELTTVKSADRNDVKAALSRQEERYRPPYGREVVTRPRRGIRVGTTNDESFLSDPTGARRFWPLHVTREIRIEWVMAHRDALWAEADARHKRGERWWFSKGEHAEELHERHEAAYDADNVEIVLRDALTDGVMAEWKRSGSVTLSEAALRIGIDLIRGPRNLPNRLGDALRRLGFVRTMVRRDGKPTKAWKHATWDAVSSSADVTTAPVDSPPSPATQTVADMLA